MTSDRHERVLRQFFVEEATGAAPPDLLDRSLARTATAQRRPRWYARMRDVGIGYPLAVGRPGVRVAYVLVVLGLVLAALLAAFVAGALRRDQVMPLGRNGSIVYFWQASNHSGAGGTFVMNADGTGGQQLVGAGCPSFSASGKVLAYVDDVGEAWVANADGSAPRQVNGIRPSYSGIGPDSGHALSPDGTQIAWWSARDELWVSPTAGGPAARIVPPSGDPQERFLAPAWSPDGRRIAFARMVSVGEGLAASGYRSAIDVVDADGSNLRHLATRPGSWTEFGIAWSPDGRSLAYTGLQDGSPIPVQSADGFYPPNDMFVIAVDGTGDRSLTNTRDDERQPSWSPDGARLAYLTANGDVSRLTTVRVDGPSRVGSPVQGPESDWFAWSPDATELLFQGLRGGGLDGHSLKLIDASLERDPTTLRDLDGGLLCPPSWQRLNP